MSKGKDGTNLPNRHGRVEINVDDDGDTQEGGLSSQPGWIPPKSHYTPLTKEKEERRGGRPSKKTSD